MYSGSHQWRLRHQSHWMKVKAEVLKMKKIINPERKKRQTEEKNPRAELTQCTPQKQGHPELFWSKVLVKYFSRKLILKLCPLYFLRRTRRRNIKSQLKNEEETFLVWLLKWLSEKKFPVKMTTPGVQQALHRELPWLSWFFKQWQKEENWKTQIILWENTAWMQRLYVVNFATSKSFSLRSVFPFLFH